MEHFEDKAFTEYSASCIWRGFVGDALAVIMKENGGILLRHLNVQHSWIKFTLDKEDNR